MKTLKKRPTILTLQFIFFIALLCSCANETSSKETSKDVSKVVEFKKVKHKIDTTLQLKFKTGIRSIFEDSKGNFWFGSHQEGVCRFDGKEFTYFTKKDGLSNNQIRTIQEDQNGTIWFATGSGLSSYDGQKFSIHTAKSNLGVENKWHKDANDLWFNGELEGGIYQYDGQKLTCFSFPILDKDHESFSITGTVTGMAQGKNNMLWMANYGGVIGYDGKSFKFINKRGLYYHVRSIFEDSNGILWIGNNGLGVLRYDGDTITNFTEQNGLSNPNYLKTKRVSEKSGTLARIFSIGEDKYGNIWFGTADSGAWRYDGESLTNYTMNDGLTSMFVWEIYKDRQGDLWFGLDDGSVHKFNGKSFDRIY